MNSTKSVADGEAIDKDKIIECINCDTDNSDLEHAVYEQIVEKS